MQATLTFLGSGTSMGVPTLGCPCAVCTSAMTPAPEGDPRNRRTRPSLRIEFGHPETHTILIDTGPDFHAQALRERIRRVDAVFYTHPHADHTLGMDDLRPLSFRNPAGIPLYADEPTTETLRRIFNYTFRTTDKYPTSARVKLEPLPPAGQCVHLFGADFQRIPVIHGRDTIVGYRFGAAAYLTDLSDLPPEAYAMLKDLDILILDALRREPHPSHSHLAKSVDFVEKIRPRRAFFTHLSHDLDQTLTEASLPPHIRLAYDGLQLTFDIRPLNNCSKADPAVLLDAHLVSSLNSNRERPNSAPNTQTTPPLRSTHEPSRSPTDSLAHIPMQVFRSLADIPTDFTPKVTTIGNFDGVHRGHRHILAEVRSRAEALGVSSLAITFEPHPIRVLRPEAPHSLITPLAQKLELLATTGIDATLVLPFTPALAALTPESFAEQILRLATRTVEIHEGGSFRFGCRGAGTLQTLEQMGFTTVICPPVVLRGAPVSSSRIRTLIANGKVSQARQLLGRPFSIRSTPASGRGFGTRYTVPTINLATYPELLPSNGVYITQITVAGEAFQAVTNIGNRPTFGADSFTVESHLLNFHPLALEQDTMVELAFLHRLRDEIRFPSPDALLHQIGVDVKKARRFFALAVL